MSGNGNPYPVSHWAQQSPINLFKAESLYVAFPKSAFSFNYSDAPFKGKFVEENHHWNFKLNKPHAGKHPPLISLNGVDAELVKIHLHTPSEHDLEGADKGGEIHLIHEIKNPTAGSTHIVLGVFFDPVDNAGLSDFFSEWASQLKDARRSKKERPEIDIDPRRLLPDTKKWYLYQGSLTSPPFSEIVIWLVFPEVLGIQSSDLNKLKKEAHQPERDVQGINRRFVLRNFK